MPGASFRMIGLSPMHSSLVTRVDDRSDHAAEVRAPSAVGLVGGERIHANARTPGLGVKVRNAYAVALRLTRRGSADFA